MRTSEKIEALAAALSKAQGALTNVKKGKTAKAGKYSYTYANISDVLELVRAPAADNGLSFVQSSAIADRLLCMTTRIMHESGQWLEVDAYANPGDWSPQSVGSTETYLRRYSLIRCFSIAAEDDDGKTAQASSPARQGPPPTSQRRHEPPRRQESRQPPPRKRLPSGSEDDKARRALWIKVLNAAKADGYQRTYDGVDKGDWRELAGRLGVQVPSDGHDMTSATLQAILDARAARKRKDAKELF